MSNATYKRKDLPGACSSRGIGAHRQHGREHGGRVDSHDTRVKQEAKRTHWR